MLAYYEYKKSRKRAFTWPRRGEVEADTHAFWGPSGFTSFWWAKMCVKPSMSLRLSTTSPWSCSAFWSPSPNVRSTYYAIYGRGGIILGCQGILSGVQSLLHPTTSLNRTESPRGQPLFTLGLTLLLPSSLVRARLAPWMKHFLLYHSKWAWTTPSTAARPTRRWSRLLLLDRMCIKPECLASLAARVAVAKQVNRTARPWSFYHHNGVVFVVIGC